MIILGWFLNILKIIFTQKIQQMDSFNCFNFVFKSQKVTFHPNLHMYLERLVS
jgi:hypothetical protein